MCLLTITGTSFVLLVQSIINPNEVMIMGGTYITPVKEGLLNEQLTNHKVFTRELRFHYKRKKNKHSILLTESQTRPFY